MSLGARAPLSRGGAGCDNPRPCGRAVRSQPGSSRRHSSSLALAALAAAWLLTRSFVGRTVAIAAARTGAATGPGALLVEGPDSARSRTLRADSAEPTADGPTPRADDDVVERVAVIESRPGFARLAVNLDRPTWLLAREPYYPGWRARVDAVPVEIRPAGGFLLAFEVPAGRHTVHLEYREPGFASGAVAALLALCPLPLALTRQARRGRK